MKGLLIAFGCLCLLTDALQPASGERNRLDAEAVWGAATNADEDESGTMKNGMWGGEHISLWVDDKGARLEYDCARGTIDRPMKLDCEGRFKSVGTHIRESGGPATQGERPNSHQALYDGRVTGVRMTITVTLTDTKETVGTFTLVYGQTPNLFKCK